MGDAVPEPTRADHIRRLHDAIALQKSLRGLVADRLVDDAVHVLQREIAALERVDAPTHGVTTLSTLERKQVTAMFADLSGFTSMSERLDPETMRGILEACFNVLVSVIVAYGGTVEKFIGDAIYAVFGAPIAHENDPERACRAALDLMDALARFNADHSLTLGLHIGINSGRVVAGEFHAHGHRQYVTTGDTVNVAARLEDRSETGEILVGPQTWRLTQQHFRYAAAGPMKLKGKSEPLPIFRLLGLRTERFDKPPVPVEAPPLVGREDALERLQTAYLVTQTGTGGALFVTGEAGLGKSSVLGAFRERHISDVVTWIEAPCLPFTGNVSHHPFITALRTHLGLSGDADVTALSHALSVISSAELRTFSPYLATWLGCPLDESTANSLGFLDAEALRGQIYAACRALFAALTLERPVVVLLEDLHLADASTLDLLAHLLGLVEQAPLLFVISCRPQASAHADQWRVRTAARLGDRCDEIALPPLDERACGLLLTALLDSEAPALRLAAKLAKQSGGNPLFLTEITRTLMDDGTLRRTDATGRWTLPVTADDVPIPASLQGVVMARVDRLDEEARLVLKGIAVIGRWAPRPLVHALLGDIPQLERSLETLETQRLLQPTHEGWTFVHPLCRDIVYDSISLQQRAALHRAVAEHLEAGEAPLSDAECGRLAWHYAEGQQWDKAQAFLTQAGDQAGRMAADAEALTCYLRALDACQKAFGASWDKIENARLERKIGEALFRQGDHQEAREHLYRARALLGRPTPTSTLSVLGAVTGAMAMHIWRTLVPPRVRTMDPRVRETLFELMRISELLEWMEYKVDQQRYTFFAFEHLAVAEDLGRLDHQAISLASLALGCDILGLSGTARRYLDRALPLAEQSGHPRAVSLASFSMGMHHFFAGDMPSAQADMTRSIAIAKAAGDAHLRGGGMVDLAGLLYVCGDMREGFAISEALTRLGESTADEQVEGWGRLQRGQFLRILDGPQAAIIELKRADRLLAAVPDPYFQVKTAALSIECLLDLGLVRDAVEALAAAEAAQKRHKLQSHFDGWLANAQTRVRIALAERDGGVAWRRAQQACAQGLRRAGSSPGTRPVAMTLCGALAWARGQRRVAERWWQRARTAAEVLGDRAGMQVVLDTVAERTGDAAATNAANAHRASLVMAANPLTGDPSSSVP